MKRIFVSILAVVVAFSASAQVLNVDRKSVV